MSDLRVAEILTGWGFQKLIPTFAAKDIDFSAFLKLDGDTLREVLSFGQYLNFKQTFFEKRKSLDEAETPPAKIPRLDNGVNGEDENANELTSDNPLSTLAQEIKDCLGRSLPGTILLLTESLAEVDRNRLSDIVISHYLHIAQPKGILKSPFLASLSEAIVELFPEESAKTYYSPYTKVNQQVFYANGKLVLQYYHWREEAIKVGHFKKYRGSSNSETSAVTAFDTSADEATALESLATELDCEETALKHWETTHEYRLFQLHNNIKLKDINAYFALFPVLRQPWASSLILADFASLQPHSQQTICSQWPTFASKVCAMFLKKKVFREDMVTHLRSTIKESGEGCQEILVHFSKLFPAQLVVKGKKPHHWSANKVETQEGFFHHVLTDAARVDFIVNRKARLGRFPKPIPFQPICIVVGTTLGAITDSYCVVATEIFRAKSPLEALDLTFKAVHALDLHYSPDSKALWRFLQHAVYNITTPSDDNISCLPALLNMYAKC